MKNRKSKQQYTILLVENYWLLGHYGKRIGAFHSRISLALFIIKNGVKHMIENPELIPPDIWQIAKNEHERRGAKRA